MTTSIQLTVVGKVRSEEDSPQSWPRDGPRRSLQNLVVNDDAPSISAYATGGTLSRVGPGDVYLPLEDSKTRPLLRQDRVSWSFVESSSAHRIKHDDNTTPFTITLASIPEAEDLRQVVDLFSVLQNKQRSLLPHFLENISSGAFSDVRP